MSHLDKKAVSNKLQKCIHLVTHTTTFRHCRVMEAVNQIEDVANLAQAIFFTQHGFKIYYIQYICKRLLQDRVSTSQLKVGRQHVLNPCYYK